MATRLPPREDSGLLRPGELQVDGVRSPFLEGGTRRAEEAVVFVHGNPGSSRDWVELAADVCAFARVVALDMPGFGRADRPRTFEYTVQGYVWPTREAEMERDHAIVVGASAHRVAARDEVVMKRLCEVLSMTATPTTLFGLATAVRVLGRSNTRGQQPGHEPARV